MRPISGERVWERAHEIDINREREKMRGKGERERETDRLIIDS